MTGSATMFEAHQPKSRPSSRASVNPAAREDCSNDHHRESFTSLPSPCDSSVLLAQSKTAFVCSVLPALGS